jgi:hypothetical protein
MAVTAEHRRMLEVADRTKDVDVIAGIVHSIMIEAPDLTLLDIETALRDAGAQSYLIAGDKPEIVLGMPAMLATLAAIGVTPEQNRSRLSLTTGK